MMDEPLTALRDFLLARIAEDETDTRELLVWAQQAELTIKDPKFLGYLIPGWHAWPDVQKICEQQLVDCKIKRMVIDLEICIACQVEYQPCGHKIRTLLLLASAHSDHLDFGPEWRLHGQAHD